MFNPAAIGVPGLIIILILLGPRKLSEIGGAVGKTLAEFKNATKGIVNDDEEQDEKKKNENQE